MEIDEAAVDKLVTDYAREAGIRNLERYLSKICEKIAFKIISKQITNQFSVTKENLKSLVGLPRYSNARMYSGIPPAGICLGLAYSSNGGSIIYIETNS